MEPCRIFSFEGDPIVNDLYYTIGQQSVTSGKYGFIQDKNCGYEETFAVNGVDPKWITHNTATKDFTVPFTMDNAAEGTYVITIRNEISVPDSADKLQYTKHFVEYEFSVIIEYCQVQDFVQ